MSKEFKVSSATVPGGLQGSFDLNTGDGFIKQDITSFVEKAKEDRDYQDYHGIRKDGYRKFATIPDAIALKMLEEDGINLHDPNFMNDPVEVARFKRIFASKYRDLVVNT